MSDINEKKKKENEFWERAFLAVLPISMDIKGWTYGDKQIDNVSGRVELAGDFATEALRIARNKKRL